MAQASHCGRRATKPANKRMGGGAECFRKGISAGFGAGIRKGIEEGKVTGKREGKVIGEVKGRARGIKIGKVALRLGHGLNLAEVDSLSKDVLRDIILRRKRKNISQVGAVSRMTKAQLKTALLQELRATHRLRGG